MLVSLRYAPLFATLRCLLRSPVLSAPLFAPLFAPLRCLLRSAVRFCLLAPVAPPLMSILGFLPSTPMKKVLPPSLSCFDDEVAVEEDADYDVSGAAILVVVTTTKIMKRSWIQACI